MNKKIIIGIAAAGVLVVSVLSYQYAVFRSDETQQLIREFKQVNKERREQWEVCKLFSPYSQVELNGYSKCTENLLDKKGLFLAKVKRFEKLKSNIFFSYSKDVKDISSEINSISNEIIEKNQAMTRQLKKQTYLN